MRDFGKQLSTSVKKKIGDSLRKRRGELFERNKGTWGKTGVRENKKDIESCKTFFLARRGSCSVVTRGVRLLGQREISWIFLGKESVGWSEKGGNTQRNRLERGWHRYYFDKLLIFSCSCHFIVFPRYYEILFWCLNVLIVDSCLFLWNLSLLALTLCLIFILFSSLYFWDFIWDIGIHNLFSYLFIFLKFIWDLFWPTPYI